MTLNTGEILNNRYRIVRLLGQGGFGAVYRAWDTKLNGPCALKQNFATTPEAEKQFAREASMLFNLRHPGLPMVFDHFSLPGQGQYLVMVYVEGEDLQQMLNRAGGPLPEEQVLPWIEQICDALQYLHNQNPPIIHRDIKPANIKITPEGQAVLVDFGIAKVFDPNLQTTLGARAITPGFSPPEQYGQGSTDNRTDIYALGATLYSLLTNTIPPDSVNVMARREPPPQPVGEANPRTSSPVIAAVTQAMELYADQRFQTIGEFKTALRGLQPQVATAPTPQKVTYSTAPAQTVLAQPVPDKISRAAPARRPSTPASARRFPKWALWGGFGVITVLVIVIALVWLGSGPSEAESTETAVAAQAMADIQNTQTAFAAIPTSTPTPVHTATPPPTSTPTPTPGPTNTPGPGSTMISSQDGMVMAFIPAGEFQMGSDTGDRNEAPVHTVHLDAFWMDQTEVTNTMFQIFADATGEQTYAGVSGQSRMLVDGEVSMVDGAFWNQPLGPGSSLDGIWDHPVVHISWEDANTYCLWAGKRLPTEAEWEKAARGGLEGYPYPWGDEEPVCSPGAYNGAQMGDCFPGTVPVMTFGPNGYGLYDMAGNVLEWASDWYQEAFYGSSPYENPQGPPNGNGRSLRGGGWHSIGSELSVTYRAWDSTMNSINYYGFRCVMDYQP